MAQTFDLHTATITVDSSNAQFWTGTIRTAEHMVTGQFGYGHIDVISDDATTYHVSFNAGNIEVVIS